MFVDKPSLHRPVLLLSLPVQPAVLAYFCQVAGSVCNCCRLPALYSSRLKLPALVCRPLNARCIPAEQSSTALRFLACQPLMLLRLCSSGWTVPALVCQTLNAPGRRVSARPSLTALRFLACRPMLLIHLLACRWLDPQLACPAAVTPHSSVQLPAGRWALQ